VTFALAASQVWSVEKRQLSAKPQAPAPEEKEQAQAQEEPEQQRGGPERQEKQEKQEKQETVGAEYLFSLCHHNYAVNALRFSPQGSCAPLFYTSPLLRYSQSRAAGEQLKAPPVFSASFLL